MAKLNSTNNNESKKSKKRNKGVIKFDEEIVKKENAPSVLEKKNSKKANSIMQMKSERGCETNAVKQEMENKKEKGNLDGNAESVTEYIEQEGQNDDRDIDAEGVSHSVDSVTKIKKNIKSKKRNSVREPDSEKNEETEIKPKKRKTSDEVQESNEVEQNDVDPEKPVLNPKVSIRAQKKTKHSKLLEEKKMKADMTNQQTVLNYLSKWKHCRDEWKFEKLKQIWLSQNMLDCSKIPNEFWETAVEYFSGSKGFIRKLVLRDALKVIENEEKLEEENMTEEQQTKVQRARDIMQNLQE